MNFKLTLSFFLLLFISSFVFGQTKKIDPIPQKNVRNTTLLQKNIPQARSIALDTIFPFIFVQDECSLELFSFFNNAGWGFVGGQNSFLDLEKAQRFNYAAANYTVEELFLYMATVEVVGDGNIFAKIYDVDPVSNGPGELIATSNPIKTSELVVDEIDVLPTLFTFSQPPQITENQFFVSVDFSELYTAQDTVSLLMTDLECGIANDAWELFGDGVTWVSMSDTLSWNILSNFFMIASVQTDGVSGVKELITGKQKIRLYDAFPNPANNELVITYDLGMNAKVQIEIYNSTGQLVHQLAKSSLIPGQYQNKIATNNFSNGTYFYSLTTDKGRLMNKFVIAKNW